MTTPSDVLKTILLNDLYDFTRYFYKQNTGKDFIPGSHFQTLSDTLEKVYRHEIKRLIINMPPRFGKTEMAVINFIAKGLALNPESKYIHTSYSDSLALENSEHVKDLITSEPYQKLFPIELKQDSKSKKKWYTDKGGGVYATSSGGQITGFGAGLMKDNEGETIEDTTQFGGAIVIDDALKPEDAQSPQVRKKINDRFYNTILSRVNSPNTPIIVIGQRLHKEDLPGKLLNDGGWHHLNLQAEKGGKMLWDYRAELVNEIKRKNPNVYMAQYQQQPENVKVGDAFFYSFNHDKHYQNTKYIVDPLFSLDVSFDFNKDPCTAVVGQHIPNRHEYHIVSAHYASPDHKSALENLCKEIQDRYIGAGPGKSNKYRLRITGDAAGRHGDADRAADVNRYTKICQYFGVSTGQVYVEKRNIEHTASRDLTNDVLHQIPKGNFVFHAGTEKLIEEIEASYPDNKGGLDKAKKELGLHALDAWRYLIKYWFAYRMNGAKFRNYQQRIDFVVNGIKRIAA